MATRILKTAPVLTVKSPVVVDGTKYRVERIEGDTAYLRTRVGTRLDTQVPLSLLDYEPRVGLWRARAGERAPIRFAFGKYSVIVSPGEGALAGKWFAAVYWHDVEINQFNDFDNPRALIERVLKVYEARGARTPKEIVNG